MRIILFLSAAVFLAGCGAGPGWTHAKRLSNSGTAIGYDCGNLKGEAAELALKNSHSLFESQYAARLFEQQAKIDKIQAQGNYHKNQVIALNQETRMLSSQVKAATAAKGCEFKGVLGLSSASRLPS